jgi:Bacterial PH domain
MRFKTKFEGWFVATPVLATIGVVGAGVLSSHPARFWFAVSLCLAIVLDVLARKLPQYYELREDGLFLRQGWTKVLIPYESVTAVDRYSSLGSRSDRVFSMDRILIIANGGERFIIAVAEEKRFLTEIWKRCPQIDPATASQVATLIERHVSP